MGSSRVNKDLFGFLRSLIRAVVADLVSIFGPILRAIEARIIGSRDWDILSLVDFIASAHRRAHEEA